MRKLHPILLVAVFTLALAACSSSDSHDEPGIVGTWVYTQQSTVKTWEFASDGGFRIIDEASFLSWSGSYSTSGEQLTLELTTVGSIPVAPPVTYSGTYAISADGQTLTLVLDGEEVAGTERILQRR